ncbi:MAG TPA: PEP-CTERM sorting domain-containing protein [Burkholderiaceae bacterium]|nr:PEP-CTERM sorting domain-containing protein [Burkholderiaceae bacterium]
MTRSARRAGALLAATLACAAAQAVPVNIGSSGGLTWELVRFAGPDSAADATFGAGVRTKVGVVPGDYCSASSANCGTAMSFATTIGGALMASASDDGDGAVNTTRGLVLQHLAPDRGGLGVVSRSAGGAVSGDLAINRGDVLTLAFANTIRLAGLHVWDQRQGGSDPNGGAEAFGLSIDDGPMQQHAMQSFLWWGGGSALVGNRFTFSYVNADYSLGAIEIVASLGAARTAAVPEPQSLALTLLGLAAIAGVARRRRPR